MGCVAEFVTGEVVCCVDGGRVNTYQPTPQYVTYTNYTRTIHINLHLSM